MANKPNDVTNDRVVKKDELEKMFNTGEAIEFNFKPLLNTKETGSSIVFEFVQDTGVEFSTKAGGKRHECIIKRYDADKKVFGDKERTGFPGQVYEKVAAGAIVVGKYYLVVYEGKKELSGGRSFNQFTIKPVNGTK